MRSWIHGTCAVLLGAVFMGVLRLPGLSDFAVTVISNGVQLAAAIGAAIGCGLAARRTAGSPPAGVDLARGRHRLVGGRPGRVELLRGGAGPGGAVPVAGRRGLPRVPPCRRDRARDLARHAGRPDRRPRTRPDGRRDHRRVAARALVGHHARLRRRGGRRRLAAPRAVARVPRRRPDPRHARAARARARQGRGASDPRAARARPGRAGHRGQRVRLPDHPRRLLLGRPGQQRLGVRLPAGGRRRLRGTPRAAGADPAPPGADHPTGHERLGAAAGPAVPATGRRRHDPLHQPAASRVDAAGRALPGHRAGGHRAHPPVPRDRWTTSGCSPPWPRPATSSSSRHCTTP